jgi:hypothetical protein
MYVYKPMHNIYFIISTFVSGLFLFSILSDMSDLNYEFNGQIIVILIIIVTGIYSLAQVIRQFILGYKVEFYENQIVIYKNKNNFKTIMSNNVIDILSNSDSIIIIYKENEIKKKLKITSYKNKKVKKILSIFYEYIKNTNPEQQKEEEKILQNIIESYDEKDYFLIRAPKWQLILFIVLLFLSLSGFISALFFLDLGKLDNGDFIPISIICGLFFFLGILGIYVWNKELMKYENGILTYVKIFKKSQSAKVTDIKYFFIGNTGNMIKVVLIDEVGETLINFIDDGTAFRTGDFLGTLLKNGVKEISELEYLRLKDKYQLK